MRLERTFARLFGKLFFSQEYLCPELLFIVLLFCLILACLILFKKKEDFASPPSSIISILACLSAIFMAVVVSGPAVVKAMENPPGPGPSEAGPSGSASESWQKYLNLSEENAASKPSSHAPSNPDPELGEEVQQVVSPPYSNAFQVQHQCIKNRLSASGRDLEDDEIDTIISFKKDIIDRMAQLDPDQDGFWIEQKDHLVAHGILKNGAEYTLPGLTKLFNNLCCSNGSAFKNIKKNNKN